MHAHPLDRPAWASLTTHHAALSVGGDLARRYIDDVNLFASARDDSDAATTALGALIEPGQQVYVLQAPGIRIPDGCAVLKQGRGVQMVATRLQDPSAGHGDWLDLGDADAAEMLALAQLTQPGPFLARTHTMGRFIGVRDGGRLVAMAGERMHLPGHTEVSGVCTHPDVRGRGLARALSAAVAARIEARGETPFLHAWADNHAAIALYESLGFALRTPVQATVLMRP